MAKRGWLAGAVRAAFTAWFRLSGWKTEGAPPQTRKFVVIAAPHTSNWDFVYFIGAAGVFGLDLSFMGKASLFRWPFGGLMRELGGVPIDRSKANNVVQAMAEEFASRDEFMLTIAPEGTRGRAREWKSGFYHIAAAAGVPMVCGLMDYKRKVAGLAEAVTPSGDYQADIEKLAAFYRTCTPKYPDLATFR